MNQQPAYMEGPGHMPSSSMSSSSSAPPLTHYSSYQQQQPIQNGVPSYGSSPVAYSHYGGYTNGLSSMHSASSSASMGSQMVQQSPMSLPTLATGTPTATAPGAPMDLTGQVAPPGMKPRVTATLWEDEGSLCFQVEAAGVCVARREDNHMINGTKLLNVAGMTRGRRDGILKSEKTRHVVKIGPMHLKGVWIPFERALDFANKEKITEKLYPLFVHNIGALLYHPQNNARQSISGATMAPAERRPADPRAEYMRTPQTSQAPTLQHHHSMSNPAHTSQPPHSIAPHPASGRPGLDRAHTFPTPPTSASSMMGMGNQGSSYEWGGAPVSSVQTTQPLSIDTTLSNQRSVPTTPASTPPANTMQSMSHYQTSGPPSYEAPRQMYASSTQGPQYAPQYSMNRFSQLQPSPSIKNEMGPPARVGEPEHNMDNKQYAAHTHEHPPSSDADNEHEGEYTHSAGPYGQHRNYGYNPNATPTSIHHDQTHVSPEMTGSPHHKGTGRATPRTATQYAGYSTPQRAQQLPSSNLYNVMSDNRNAQNGADVYSHGYPSQPYQPTNGMPPSNKRGLDMNDDEANGVKRQKTHDDGTSLNDRVFSRPRSVIAQKKR